MRSIYSDPVNAGIDAFSKVVGAVGQMQDVKNKRELMAQHEADRRIQMERQAKVDERQDKLWAEEDEKKYGQKTLNNLASVYDAQQKADAAGTPLNLSNLSDDQVSSVLKMAGDKKLIGADGKVDPSKLEGIKTIQSVMQDPSVAEAMKQKKQIRLDLTKDKRVGDALSLIYGDDFNKGFDRAGNIAAKKPVAAMIDFSGNVPTVAFELEVTPPRNGTGNLIPLQGYEKDVYSIPEDPKPAGMIDRGNIDLAKRKVAINEGSISTVLSRSFNFDGKEVLLPLVNDAGKIVSDKEAIDEYKKTGKHLGTFDTPQDATQYAEKLHSSKIWQPTIDYYKGSYQAPMTFGRDGSPDAPIQQIPVPLLSAQLNSLSTLGNWVNQLEAQYGSTEFSKRIQSQIKAKQAGDDAARAWDESGGSTKKFARTLMDKGMLAKDISDYQKLFTEKEKAQPTKAGLALSAASGDAAAKNALDILAKSEGKKGKEGDIRHYESEGRVMYEEFKNGQWMPKSSSPKFKPSSSKDSKNSASDFKRANDDYDEYWITEYGKNAQTEDGKKIDIKQLLNSKSKEDDNFTLGDNIVKGRFNDEGKPLKVKELYEYGKTQLDSYLENGMKPSQAYTQARKDISEYGSKKSFLKKSGQDEFHVEIKKPKPGTKLTDKKVIGAYMKAAGGDKKEAAKLATADGWDILK